MSEFKIRQVINIPHANQFIERISRGQQSRNHWRRDLSSVTIMRLDLLDAACDRDIKQEKWDLMYFCLFSISGHKAYCWYASVFIYIELTGELLS